MTLLTRSTYWSRPRGCGGGDGEYDDGSELERVFPRRKARMRRRGAWMERWTGGGGGRRRWRLWGNEENEEEEVVEAKAVEELGPGAAEEVDEGM